MKFDVKSSTILVTKFVLDRAELADYHKSIVALYTLKIELSFLPTSIPASQLFYNAIFFTLIKVFTGNSNRHTIVYHDFVKPFSAVYVRIHPKGWYSWISLRAEIYGCYGMFQFFFFISL